MKIAFLELSSVCKLLNLVGKQTDAKRSTVRQTTMKMLDAINELANGISKCA